jgi:hypothetical protein
VGVVNLDMPMLLYDFQDLVAFGADHSTLGQLVARAVAQANVTCRRIHYRRRGCSPGSITTVSFRRGSLRCS